MLTFSHKNNSSQNKCADQKRQRRQSSDAWDPFANKAVKPPPKEKVLKSRKPFDPQPKPKPLKQDISLFDQSTAEESPEIKRQVRPKNTIQYADKDEPAICPEDRIPYNKPGQKLSQHYSKSSGLIRLLEK